MFDKQELIKSFNQQEEKILFAKVLDNAELCIKKRINVFTNFLDPAKIEQYTNKLNSIDEINYKVFGGYKESERKIIGFYNEYTHIDEHDFPIKIVKIKLLDKFCENLNHRQYLGSILATGIERTKLGDIIVIDNYGIAFIHENMVDYVCTNLTKVSRTKVDNSIIDLSEIELPVKKYKELNITVASLRIDVIVSTVFHISRGKTNDLINSEKVNINWSVSKSNSLLLKKGDIISLRGYGKAEIVEVKGKTHKGRIAILINVYI